MDPILNTLISELTAMATKSVAQTIAIKIADIKRKTKQEEAIQELIQIINELIEERDKAITIAQGLKEQLTAQQISEENIEFITKTIAPLFLRIEGEESSDEENNPETTKELINLFINKDTLSVLQIVGFNYKEAIGDPLTHLVRDYLLSLNNSETGTTNTPKGQLPVPNTSKKRRK